MATESVSLHTLYKKADTRGDIKVKKEFTVLLKDMYIEDGFNVRYGEITVDSVEGLIKAYLSGQPIPPIVIEPQPDNRFKVIGGHRRFTALTHIVNTLGHTEFERVEVNGINCSEADTIKYMVGENSGKNLNAVDLAIACGKLRDLNLTPAEIGSELGFSESKVNYHLTINKMSDEVKTLIIDGLIAADFAADIFRKKGNQGVLDIVAGKSDGKKVTRANSGLWRPSMGKSVVGLFRDVSAHISDNNATITMSVEQWEEVQKAVKALGETDDAGSK